MNEIAEQDQPQLADQNAAQVIPESPETDAGPLPLGGKKVEQEDEIDPVRPDIDNSLPPQTLPDSSSSDKSGGDIQLRQSGRTTAFPEDKRQ